MPKPKKGRVVRGEAGSSDDEPTSNPPAPSTKGAKKGGKSTSKKPDEPTAVAADEAVTAAAPPPPAVSDGDEPEGLSEVPKTEDDDGTKAAVPAALSPSFPEEELRVDDKGDANDGAEAPLASAMPAAAVAAAPTRRRRRAASIGNGASSPPPGAAATPTPSATGAVPPPPPTTISSALEDEFGDAKSAPALPLAAPEDPDGSAAAGSPIGGTSVDPSSSAALSPAGDAPIDLDDPDMVLKQAALGGTQRSTLHAFIDVARLGGVDDGDDGSPGSARSTRSQGNQPRQISNQPTPRTAAATDVPSSAAVPTPTEPTMLQKLVLATGNLELLLRKRPVDATAQLKPAAPAAILEAKQAATFAASARQLEAFGAPRSGQTAASDAADGNAAAPPSPTKTNADGQPPPDPLHIHEARLPKVVGALHELRRTTSMEVARFTEEASLRNRRASERREAGVVQASANLAAYSTATKAVRDAVMAAGGCLPAGLDD